MRHTIITGQRAFYFVVLSAPSTVTATQHRLKTSVKPIIAAAPILSNISFAFAIFYPSRAISG